MRIFYFLLLILIFLAGCNSGGTTVDLNPSDGSTPTNIPLDDNGSEATTPTEDQPSVVPIDENNASASDENESNQSNEEETPVTPTIVPSSTSSTTSVTNTKGVAYLGNIASATVNIYEMDVDGNRLLRWTETTSGGTLLEEIGLFDTHSSELSADKYYLYEIVGGEDWDSNDDGVLDQNATINNGVFISIVQGALVQRLENFTVSYLSDYFSRYLQYALYREDLSEVEMSLLADIFDANVSDYEALMSELYQYHPSRDFDKLSDDLKNLVPDMVEAIKTNTPLDITDYITMNGITIENQEVGLEGELLVELNLTSKIALEKIVVHPSLRLDEEHAFDTIYIPEIHKGTEVYPIEIDLGSYHELVDGNITPLTISGSHTLELKVNDTNISTSFDVNFTANALVKFLNLSLAEDLTLVDDLDKEIEEILEDNGSITTQLLDPNATLFELVQNGEDFIFSPTIELISYSDQNLTGLHLDVALWVNSQEYTLPIENFVNIIDINATEQSSLMIDCNITQLNKREMIKGLLSNIMIVVNNNVDLTELTNLYLDPTITVEDLVNAQLDTLAPLARQASTIDAHLQFTLLDGNDTELDTYSYPINLTIGSDIFEELMSNLSSLISGDMTIETLLDTLGA